MAEETIDGTKEVLYNKMAEEKEMTNKQILIILGIITLLLFSGCNTTSKQLSKDTGKYSNVQDVNKQLKTNCEQFGGYYNLTFENENTSTSYCDVGCNRAIFDISINSLISNLWNLKGTDIKLC